MSRSALPGPGLRRGGPQAATDAPGVNRIEQSWLGVAVQSPSPHWSNSPPDHSLRSSWRARFSCGTPAQRWRTTSTSAPIANVKGAGRIEQASRLGEELEPGEALDMRPKAAGSQLEKLLRVRVTRSKKRLVTSLPAGPASAGTTGTQGSRECVWASSSTRCVNRRWEKAARSRNVPGDSKRYRSPTFTQGAKAMNPCQT